MDRKTLSIVLGIILIGVFFLPYLSVAGFFKVSGFDMIKGNTMSMSGNGGNAKGLADLYIMLLWPLAGLALLLGALNNNKYIVGTRVIGILALVGILYPIIRILIQSKGEGMGEIFRFLGIGFWLSLVAAVVVIAYNPSPKQTSS